MTRTRTLRRATAVAAVMLAGLGAQTPPASAAGSYCARPADGSFSLYCQIYTTGGSGSGATGTSGVTKLWINWPEGGDHLDGDICVADTWANGRGVKVKLGFHRYSSGSDTFNSTNYEIRGPFKDSGNTSCPNGTSQWVHYSVSALSGGYDYARLQWADTWSGCDYCVKGSYKINFPVWD